MAKRKSPSKKAAKKKNTKAASASLKKWWSEESGERKPILLFWTGFAGIMLLYYILAIQPFFVENIQEPVGAVFAYLGSGLLSLMGQGTVADGAAINSGGFSLLVKKGCDAIAPVMLVVTGISLFPAERNKKLKGIAIGVFTLFALNLFRIVTLYFVGVHAPGYFEFMHVEFWQVLFIGLAVLYFFYWLNWATKTPDHAQVS